MVWPFGLNQLADKDFKLPSLKPKPKVIKNVLYETLTVKNWESAVKLSDSPPVASLWIDENNSKEKEIVYGCKMLGDKTIFLKMYESRKVHCF